MAKHYFHVEGLSLGFLAATVGVSYLLSSAASVWMVIHGFRHKTYAMPPAGLMALLSVCLICVFGPFSDQSHLFYYRGQTTLLITWGLDALLVGIVFAQYVTYGGRQAHRDGQLALFHLLVWSTFTVVGYGIWSFIIFYQDYYVNEICPIALFIVAAGYVRAAMADPQWRGLSLGVAWLLGLSNVLLFGAVVAGNMSDPYPEAEYGYGFIYWLYAVTLILNFVYVYQATVQRRGARLAAPAVVRGSL
ncbi:MAG TPA: hypothetical protein VFO19_07950 [Vicinamibacterales bacterium]|nr:hypothetical protein [Vicinamibacterales bacterium]